MSDQPETALDICNTALRQKLGEPWGISAITPYGTLPSRLCYNQYHENRMYTLCEAYWPFSIHTETLTPTPDGIHYHLPRPCLRLRSIRTETGHYLPKEEWRITNRILTYRGTPHKNLTLTYTSNEEDIRKFTPDFIAAFITRLAASLALPLLNSEKTHNKLRAEYQTLIEQQNNQFVTPNS